MGSVLDAYRQQAGLPPEDEGFSPFGFLGNIVEGAKEATIGFGKLIAAVPADLIHAGAELATGGNFEGGSYWTADIVRGLAAMPSDLAERYGALSPFDDRPASEFLHQIYEKPVSFGLDALAVAAGAGAAAKALGGGSKLLGITGKIEGNAAAVAARETAMAELAGKVAPRTQEAAAVRAGLEALGPAGEKVPWYTSLLPEQTPVRIGNQITSRTTLRNPLLRSVAEPFQNKFLRETIESARAAVPDRMVQLGGGASRAEAFRNRELGLLDVAEQGFGMTRIEKPFVAAARASRVAQKAEGFYRGEWFRARLRDQNKIKELLGPIVRDLQKNDPDQYAALSSRLLGTNLNLRGHVSPEEIASHLAEEIGKYGKTIDLVPEGARPALRTAEELPDVAAAEPGLAADAPKAIDILTKARDEAARNVTELDSLGFEPERFVEGANRLIDTIVRDLEAIRDGHADQSFLAAARMRVHDILTNETEISMLRRRPEYIIEESNRMMRIANGLEPDDAGLVRNLSLPEVEQMRTDLLSHLGDVEYVRGQIRAILESGDDISVGLRKLLTSEQMQRLLPSLQRVMDRSRELEGLQAKAARLEADLAGLDTPRSAGGTQIFERLGGNVTQADLRASRTAMRGQLDNVRARISELEQETTTALPWETINAENIPEGKTEQVISGLTEMFDQSGGLINDVLYEGGLPAQKGAMLTLMENLREVVGAEQADKLMAGVKDLKTFRKRLRDFKENPMRYSEDSWMAVDDAIRAAREADPTITAPTYYPMIDVDRVKTSDWLMASPDSTSLKRAMDPHEKYNTGLLFRRGAFEKDPMKAYMRRAARRSRMDGSIKAIERVVQSGIGRKVMPGEPLALDEVAIPMELMRGVNHISQTFWDGWEKAMGEGKSSSEAFIEGLGAMQDKAFDVIDGVNTSGVTMYAIPKVAARRLNAAARAAGVFSGSSFKIWLQTPINVWRSLVLAGSPRWLVNNLLGNTVFSVMQGAPIGRAMHLMEQKFKRFLNEKYGLKFNTAKLAEVERFFDELGIRDRVADSGYNRVEMEQSDFIPGASSTSAGRAIIKARQAQHGFMRGTRKIGHVMRSINSAIEDAYRMNSALTQAERAAGISKLSGITNRYMVTSKRMSKLMDAGIPKGGAVAESIVAEMNKFLGDFTSLGPWERNVVRPYIAPFWGFYKHTAKLLLRFPFEYPGRAVLLNQLAEVTNDLTSELGPVPSWLESALPLGPAGDSTKFLTTTGPNPFSGIFQSPLGQLSPLLKVPAEQFMGRDLFTMKPFSDYDTVSPFGTDQQFRIIRDENGYPVAVEPVERTAPGLLEHIAQQIPQYELLKEGLGGGKTYDTASILDVLPGTEKTGLIKDENGNVKYPVSWGEALSGWAGYKPVEYDLAGFQEWLAEQEQAALAEAQRTRA